MIVVTTTCRIQKEVSKVISFSGDLTDSTLPVVQLVLTRSFFTMTRSQTVDVLSLTLRQLSYFSSLSFYISFLTLSHSQLIAIHSILLSVLARILAFLNFSAPDLHQNTQASYSPCHHPTPLHFPSYFFCFSISFCQCLISPQTQIWFYHRISERSQNKWYTKRIFERRKIRAHRKSCADHPNNKHIDIQQMTSDQKSCTATRPIKMSCNPLEKVDKNNSCALCCSNRFMIDRFIQTLKDLC